MKFLTKADYLLESMAITAIALPIFIYNAYTHREQIALDELVQNMIDAEK